MSQRVGKLNIRTEASTRIGMGHFMRCFAVAEAARGRGWAVTFLLSEPDAATQGRAAAIGADIAVMPAPLGQDADAVAAIPGDWLLIDSYAAGEAYISDLSSRTHVAVLDDLAVLTRFNCRLLINPAQAAPGMGYKHLAADAHRLLGPDYALIRAEFRRDHPPAAKPFIAVMFGGSDPDDLTGGCVRLLRQALPDMAIRVIAGPANRQVEALRRIEAEDPNLTLYVDPPSVASVLAHARLAVTAAGGTLGEVAAMGLPALALVVYDNQGAALKACPFPVVDARTGFPADLGQRVRTLIEDATALKAIADSGHAMVDGKGPDRILDAMEALT